MEINDEKFYTVNSNQIILSHTVALNKYILYIYNKTAFTRISNECLTDSKTWVIFTLMSVEFKVFDFNLWTYLHDKVYMSFCLFVQNLKKKQNKKNPPVIHLFGLRRKNVCVLKKNKFLVD